MRLKAPKPVDRTGRVLKAISDGIENQEQLDAILDQIPEAGQRYAVLDKLTPLLKFKPAGLVKETA